MRSADLLIMARRRAGLTQTELAGRLSVPQSTITRWECGARVPSLETVLRVVEVCGLDLTLSLRTGDASYPPLIADQLALAPAERLRSHLGPVAADGVLALMTTIARRSPATVFIGDAAAALQGAPQQPRDLRVDVVAPAGEDVGLLAWALEQDGDPVDKLEPPVSERASAVRWTSGDALVIHTRPAGTAGHHDLARDAAAVDADAAGALRLASVRDLLRIADASSDAHDRATAPALRALLEHYHAPQPVAA